MDEPTTHHAECMYTFTIYYDQVLTNSSMNQNLPINTRSFSHTTTLSSSSPFRLSSNKNTNPNPNTKPHDNANDNDAYEPYYNEEEDHLSRYTPYKPKRQWPPDMTKLSPKHQFRLERKYRRRAALKFARPKWTKGTKLVQWGVIGCVFLSLVFGGFSVVFVV